MLKINKRALKDIPLDTFIIGLSSLAFIWTLTPCLLSHQAAVPIVLCLALAFALMCFDPRLPVSRRKDVFYKYLGCGAMSLFFWLIGRRDMFSFVEYAANNIIIWFPVAFSYYILYRQPETKGLQIILGVLLSCSLLTGITTLFGLYQYPMASRWLAGAHKPGMIAMLRGMNIGGYSYIYAMGLLFPVALGFVLSSKNDRSIGRALGVLAVFLLPIVIFFSQYMIALYMVIYTALVTCAFLWFGGMKRVQKRARSRWKTMLLALVIALVLFALIWVPLHYAIRNVARTLGLKSLHARAESVLLSHTNEEFRDTIWKTLSQEDGLFDDDFNEQGDAMLARSQMYSMMLNSVSLSPFFGRLSDNRVIISNHSEFLDGLLGGGLFGAVIYLLLLYHIFEGLVRQVLAPSKLFGSVLLMGCLLVGLAAVNTVTKSREIILMCTVFPVTAVLLSKGAQKDKSARQGLRLADNDPCSLNTKG